MINVYHSLIRPFVHLVTFSPESFFKAPALTRLPWKPLCLLSHLAEKKLLCPAALCAATVIALLTHSYHLYCLSTLDCELLRVPRAPCVTDRSPVLRKCLLKKCMSNFYVLADVNKATVNTGVHMFSGCITNSGFAESYSSFIFSFLRNRHNVLHSGFINLQSKCPMTDECIKMVIHTHTYI